MASVPLIHTQLVPPRIKHYIQRNRLRDLGHSILSHHVTTVIAPAGYGKSVWISSLLEEPGWPPTAWLSLDRHDRAPSFLLSHLINAIKRALPQFGDRSLRTMNSLEDVSRDWLIVVSSLMEEVSENDKLVLILDDVHIIEENSIICDILEHLIRWLPAEIHLVLISRNNPSLNFYRKQLSGELLEIRSNQLVFSIDESRDFLSILGLQLEESELAMIHALAEGWAAALYLLGILAKQSGGDIKKTLSALSLKGVISHTYLSNELLNDLPQELYNFLLDSSLLPYLEPELCNAIFSCSDSEAKLKHLHALGILSQIEGETTTWRLHHLMGRFMVQKATCFRSADYIVSIRQHTAAFLEHKGDIGKALEQLMACADWPSAMKLIHIHGDSYFLQGGRLAELHSWLDRLPAELVNNDPWLLYFKGMTLLHNNQEEALNTLSRSADYAGKTGDIKCQISSLFAMIGAYAFAHNEKKIKETAERIPLAAALLKNSWSRGIVLLTALGQAAWEDNLKQGVWLSWLVGKCKLDPLPRTTYLCFSCMIQFRMGNLTSAVNLIEKLLADPYVRENEHWTGEAYTIYTAICELTGNHHKLREICTELLRLGQKYHAPHQLGFAHRSLAHLHLNDGHQDKARREFNLSRNTFLEANNIYYAYLIDLELILLRTKSGEKSMDLLAETEYTLSKLNTFPGGRGLDDYALSVAGIIAMEMGQLILARQRFEKVILKCKQRGTRQVLAGTQLFLARISLLQGNDSATDDYLREALGSAAAEKWEFFGHWHTETVYNLCQRALLKKIHPNWAAHLLRRWFPHRICKEASNLLVNPDESIRKKIIMLLQNMAQEKGKPLVHINCLDDFRVFINGIELSPSQWKTKKAISLVKFLIIDRRQHEKEKIIEALWPESDPGLGEASLRMALTHARKALGLNEYVGESVILRRGLIYLNPDIEIYTDYELFSSAAQSVLGNTDTGNPIFAELLEQVAKLYRGDLLPANLYDDWTNKLRTQLQQLFLQLLLKLIEAYNLQGRPIPAIQVCRRYLALDPADETVCRIAMELLYQSGKKQQALNLYRDLTAILEKEYGIVPTAKTVDLYKKIRSNHEITLC